MSDTNTLGQIGRGMRIGYSDTEGGSYTYIAEVLDIKPPKTTVDKVEVMRHDREDGHVERIPGWKSVDDTEVQLMYTAVEAATLYGLLGLNQYWQVIKPDSASKWAFYGFLSEHGDESPIKDKMTNTFKVTTSGDAPFTASGGVGDNSSSSSS